MAQSAGSIGIGIDLGTAYTCVGVFRDGHVEIIPDEGRRTMPSYVAFTDTGRLIGAAARNQASINPRNTIWATQRLLGRKFHDVEVQALMRHFPFTVTSDAKSRCQIVADYRGEMKRLTPEEILSMIILRARENAEAYLGTTVEYAVITVPATYSSFMRRCIREAAEIGGTRVLYIVPSSTATAFSHTVDTRSSSSTSYSSERNVLVFDLGAATVDVTLFTAEEGIIEVKASGGDIFLGGEDFDTRLVNHFIDEIKQSHKKDISRSARSLRRLRTAAERAKCELSSQSQAHVHIESIYEGIHFSSTITRTRFEELCSDLFRSTIQPIERALMDAKIDRLAVHQVVMVGGSSRIPKIQSMVSNLFGGRELFKAINPDEAAACGAAMMASIFTGNRDFPKLDEMLLLDALPNSIGIETTGGVMHPMIKRNTLKPTKKTESFSTSADNQNSFTISVYEGERTRAKDNYQLGKGTLPLTPAPRGELNIQVTLDVDNSDHVNVEAKQENNVVQIFASPPRFLYDEMQQMKLEAEKYKADEVADAERRAAKDALESYVYELKEKLYFSERMMGLTDIIMAWLDENQSVRPSEYRSRKSQLEKLAAEVTNESSFVSQEKKPSIPEGIHPVQEGTPDASQGIQNRTIQPDGEGLVPSKFSAAEWPEASGKDARRYQAPFVDHDPPEALEPTIRDGHTVSENERPSEVRNSSEPSVIAPTQEPFKSSQPSAASSKTLSSVQAVESSFLAESRSSTPGAGGIASFFSTPIGEVRPPYTDIEFFQIATYLRNTGRQSWSVVPRLYTVLRLIGQLQLLDSFVDEGITDMWFPFKADTLPHALSPSIRSNFVDSQSLVLSKALNFEKSSDRKHAHFAQGEPLPFEVVGRLGSGAHGYVDKVMSVISLREYARKLFRRARGVGKDEIRSFLTELQILKRIDHIHCVELIQSYTDPKYFAILISPVADCNLFEYYSLASESADKLSLLRSFFGCLANALQYLHAIKIRHRDIKPQNILVKGDRVFLTDFGIALDWEHLSRSTTTEDSGKTWVYAAPEVARFQQRNSSSDVWSLGCVFLEMLTVLKGEKISSMRSYFEEHGDNYRFYTNLANGNIPEWTRKLRPLGLTKDNAVVRWIARMLQETPGDRPTAATLFIETVTVSTSEGALFCGPCCKDGNDSSELDDDDPALWEQTEGLTIRGE